MNLSPGKTEINNLVELKHMVLNSPATLGDQIKLNYIHNNKVDTISDMDPPKDNCGTCNFMNILNFCSSK